MRVAFMGTPLAAVPSLRALASMFDVAIVVTQPDRRAGRGRVLTASPVKEAAHELGVPTVLEPVKIRTDAQVLATLRAASLDAIAVVAFGQILPQGVLEVPRLGCVNVHFSLLPRWRGAAPVERAILAGDAETGVTTMMMDEGLDTGDMLDVATIPITSTDSSGSLRESLAEIGAELLVKTLESLGSGNAVQTKQDDGLSTHAPKIAPEDRILDWRGDASDLNRQVRALHPKPGAFTIFRRRRLDIIETRLLFDETGAAGTFGNDDPDGPTVFAGTDALQLLRVRPEGKQEISGSDFLHGYRPAPGESVG